MDLFKLLPFLEDEELEELANKIINSETNEFKGVRIGNLLPFLDEDFIGQLAKLCVQEGKSYHEFLPFLDDDDVDDILLKVAVEHPLRHEFYSLLPFASSDALSKLLDLILKKESEVDVNKIYPFLDEDDISKLFKIIMSQD